jgi:hypothetical protein
MSGSAVSFINRGLIDLRAIRTFGMSAKECENPIGFFGTGFKYAIAVCLRLGCRITLHRGLERFEFDTGHAELRGTAFKIVRMQGEDLAFTTDLGKTWEAWQAFRELYCNALDEGGSVFDGECDPAEDHTTVVVHGHQFHAAYLERGNIVLQSPPRWRTSQVEIHQRSSHFGFYRGIRATQLQQHAMLTYNVVRNLELTEDRTVKNIYAFNGAVRDAILGSVDADLVRAFLKSPTGSFESSLDLDGWTTPGELFLSTVGELGFRDCTNQSAFKVFKKHRKTMLQPDAMPLNKVETMQLERAVRFCKFMGYTLHDYEIVVTNDLEENTWGRAYEGRIYINRSAFAHGTKVVAGTLIEEYIHLRHKLDDESRALQNHLLNALVSMGELAMGEPV